MVASTTISTSAVYKSDPRLPSGWTMLDKGRKTYFKTKGGKFVKNSRKLLAEMWIDGGCSELQLSFVRDGLAGEGWKITSNLPKHWMFKQYTHKIEGVDSDVLYLLSPKGVIFRSKKSLRTYCSDEGLGEKDLDQIMTFKPEYFNEPKKLVYPDENWLFDSECVPEGWKFKRYTFNSKLLKRVEVVVHYLSPDCTILRGRKQVYDYMVESNTFNVPDFQKFHFNKNSQTEVGKPKVINWGEWEEAEGLHQGWKVREGQYKFQKKVQYISPCHRIFNSRLRVISFLKHTADVDAEPLVSKRLLHRYGGQMSSWEEWRSNYIPCLPGWMFSIGQSNMKRRIRYMSPGGTVFLSRGNLIRFLTKNNLRTSQQLMTLKKLLKTNQAKHFDELRKNDKFIKNFEADFNYLLFLKIRYENDSGDEISADKLPYGWKKKLINGVDYFRDPSKLHVFNSRQLVVEHLRGNRLLCTEGMIKDILEDSEPDSDLSESEFEDNEEE